MKTIMTLALIGEVLVGGVSAGTPLAWPQFRGPNGSGIAEGQKPPLEFSLEQHLKWRTRDPIRGRLGRGHRRCVGAARRRG